MVFAAGHGRDDRLSNLGDAVLGNILSFLPASEAGRAAALSSRYRDVFASVHSVSMVDPDRRLVDCDDRGCMSPGYCGGHDNDPDQPPPFTAEVSAALLARLAMRRPGSAAAAPPMRALRVAMRNYRRRDSSTVDRWISYAQKQAAPQLEIDLKLRQVDVCLRRYTLSRAISPEEQEDRTGGYHRNSLGVAPIFLQEDQDVHAEQEEEPDSDVVSRLSTIDESAPSPVRVGRWHLTPSEYTVPAALFSFATLRSLSIGPCRLSPPAAVSLPCLEALLLTDVSDEGHDVERLVHACPRLADLTLEACAVTELSLVGLRIRRLALRCCHQLQSIAVDSSALRAFEYRGAVPRESFMTMRGGSPRLTSCKVDICGEEVSSAAELAMLGEFLQLVASHTQHLHVKSARLGSSLVRWPAFSGLRHLELRGWLPHGDDGVVGVMGAALRCAPDLEVLSLLFELGLDDDVGDDDFDPYSGQRRMFYVADPLKYNPYCTLDAPSASIPFQVKEMNLVNYQGGNAQRALAKFLLRNAPLLRDLWCEFAQGPLSIQTDLMREIQGWVINQEAKFEFF